MLKIGDTLFDLSQMGEIFHGKFIERKNRFIGIVEVEGKEYICHIADTGRLKEILTEGRDIILVKNPPTLKTDFKLIACKMEQWALINTSIHSKIARNAIEKGVLGFIPEKVKSEVKTGKSRLDFLVDNIYIELKGSNLLIGDKCIFPDAPTVRGLKHLNELIELKKSGNEAGILIMALRDCNCFETNKELDPDFSLAFDKAIKHGVKFFGFKVKIKNNKVVYNGQLNIC
ncbi:sugar fermentation stimulation protein A [Thermotomaculum hydrothermale]|uniref:Sugar fermentation stimulation protein A n=1 Tax=Thermotomaculum hydrothermale TaxID=981385 RepID=A0A7R6Q0J4_9BACT|nr:DNA/RNA nuclease SfsA [Thermotomaculum hydrothermale]BBB33313.1 sugar fermentation stimulation protein A [Thermotomaculum hydrothermale]